MKTKSKLLLALSALTVGTVAAGTTATFAWFTTNRTASAHLTNITAANPNGNLKIGFTSIHAKTTGSTTDADPTNITRTFNHELRDLSSKEGFNFYAPVWDASSDSQFSGANGMDIPQEYKAYTWQEGTREGFIQFTLTITNVGSSALDVYLDPSITSITGTTVTASSGSDLNSEQTAQQSANNSLASFMRVGISSLENTSTNNNQYGGGSAPVLTEYGNLVFMDSQNYNSFVSEAGEVTAAGDHVKQYTGNEHFFYDVNDDSANGGLDDLTSIAAQSTNSQRIAHANYLGKVQAAGTEGQDSIYVTVAVWLEGTCNNTDAADGGSIDIDLGFTALDPAAA